MDHSGKFDNLDQSIDKIDDDIDDFNSDISDITSDVDSISDLTDDLYTGVIKILDDRGIDFLEVVSNSVRYRLDRSDTKAIISFDDIDKEVGVTNLTIRYDNDVLLENVWKRLSEDNSLYEIEEELFNTDITLGDGRPGEPGIEHRGQNMEKFAYHLLMRMQ